MAAILCFMPLVVDINAAGASGDVYNPAHEWFVTSGGAMRPISSETVKNGIRFTSPYTKDVKEINLLTCYHPWKPENNPKDTPTLRIGIQAMDVNGYPTETWIGSSTVKPTADHRQWVSIALTTPVHIEKDNVYNIVIQWESGTVDDKHYAMFYSNCATELSPYLPFNYDEKDTNVNRKDPYSASIFFNGSSWSLEPNKRDKAAYYITFTDNSCFGQPFAHAGVVIYDTQYAGQIITIVNRDKTVDQLQCVVCCENRNGNLLYSIDEVAISDNTIDVLNTLSSGVMVTKEAGSKSFKWERKDLKEPVTLLKGRTYLIKFTSPNGKWKSDAPGADEILYNGVYPNHVEPYPSDSDRWFAKKARALNYYEHLVSMTYDGRNSYFVRTREGKPAHWVRESMRDLPFKLRLVENLNN
jgi:hypothetical protein